MEKMASTISSSPKSAALRRKRAFTLVEVLISASLGSMILAAVLSAFIMVTKSGVRISNYSTMETETRRAFEQLGVDARMANNFVSNYTSGVITSFTLTIPSNDLSTQRWVKYGYDTSDATNKKFYMVAVNSSGTAIGTTFVLVNKVTSLTFLRYDTSDTLIPASTTADTGVKHIQVSISVSRSTVGVAAATQVIRSSAFTIRNITI
jgi:prepilin-type N-terminal cleavage/methylation domain-containing protein